MSKNLIQETAGLWKNLDKTRVEYQKDMRKGWKGKVFNRKRSNWAYYQFRSFLQYKAEEKGKFVYLIDPRFTSQQCKNCLHIAKENRKGKIFHCLKCNYIADADINASKNISRRGAVLFFEQAVVNQPYISNYQALLRLETTPKQKA